MVMIEVFGIEIALKLENYPIITVYKIIWILRGFWLVNKRVFYFYEKDVGNVVWLSPSCENLLYRLSLC